MKNLKHSIGIRLFIIAFLTIALLIPSILILNLISEREQRRDSVADEISQKWGKEQIITGPLISIPYIDSFKSGNKINQIRRYVHFLPRHLDIKGTVTPEVRYRGIYKVIVYNSQLSISGNFPPINLSSLNVSPKDILPEKAFVSVGISDMAGIKESIDIRWDDEELSANPGIETDDVLVSGVSVYPDLEAGPKSDFNFELSLNGSSGLYFSLVGEQTNVQLSSDWPHPSFTGNFLPVDRKVSSSGFTATWSILHLNRNFSQQWQGPNQELTDAAFGVDLLLPVDEYQKTMRTAKYAISLFRWPF